MAITFGAAKGSWSSKQPGFSKTNFIAAAPAGSTHRPLDPRRSGPPHFGLADARRDRGREARRAHAADPDDALSLPGQRPPRRARQNPLAQKKRKFSFGKSNLVLSSFS